MGIWRENGIGRCSGPVLSKRLKLASVSVLISASKPSESLHLYPTAVWCALALWLISSPGCSSLFGDFLEKGPFDMLLLPLLDSGMRDLLYLGGHGKWGRAAVFATSCSTCCRPTGRSSPAAPFSGNKDFICNSDGKMVQHAAMLNRLTWSGEKQRAIASAHRWLMGPVSAGTEKIAGPLSMVSFDGTVKHSLPGTPVQSPLHPLLQLERLGHMVQVDQPVALFLIKQWLAG